MAFFWNFTIALVLCHCMISIDFTNCRAQVNRTNQRNGKQLTARCIECGYVKCLYLM